VFGDTPGSFDICPICFWEDDIVQLAFPDMTGGANRCSLIEGQRNFVAFGVCERRLKPNVRAPAESDARDRNWRPLETERDHYLRWETQEDRQLWQSVKESEPCLYYWKPEFWLHQQRAQRAAGDK
jgi:hypothetical protein